MPKTKLLVIQDALFLLIKWTCSIVNLCK